MKKERLKQLQDLLNRRAWKSAAKWSAPMQRILVTDYSKKDPGELQGRTENNRIVNFRCDNPRLIGQFADVLHRRGPTALAARLAVAISQSAPM